MKTSIARKKKGEIFFTRIETYKPSTKTIILWQICRRSKTK